MGAFHCLPNVKLSAKYKLKRIFRQKNYIFKASGYTVTFDGYTVLYEEGKDEEEEAKGALPVLENGMPLKCKELVGNQHFTQPPPRYTEASLIKALEEKRNRTSFHLCHYHFYHYGKRICHKGK